MKDILTIMLCGVIGYATNYIAIKMLFRPYNEIRIAGMRVPFTPGVIPKGRERIAGSTADAIGDHILTKDSLEKIIKDEKIKNQILLIIHNAIVNNINSDKSIKQIMNKDNQDVSVEDKISMYFGDIIISNFREEENINSISQSIHTYIQKTLIQKKHNIKNNTDVAIGELLSSSSIKSLIKNTYDTYKAGMGETVTLRNIIKPITLDDVEKKVIQNEDKILSVIRCIISEEKIQESIKESASKIIKSQLGSLVSMFLPDNAVGDKAVESITKYIENSDNRVEILRVVSFLVYKTLDMRVNDIINVFENVLDIDSSINELHNNNKVISSISSIANEALEVISQRYKVDFNNTVLGIIKTGILSSDFEQTIRMFTREVVANIISKPIKSFNIQPADSQLDLICKGILNNLYKSVDDNIDSITSAIDIKTIVMEKIKGFDVVYAENIILGIVRKELRAITNLGGVLGAIIGLLTIMI